MKNDPGTSKGIYVVKSYFVMFFCFRKHPSLYFPCSFIFSSPAKTTVLSRYLYHVQSTRVRNYYILYVRVLYYRCIYLCIHIIFAIVLIIFSSFYFILFVFFLKKLLKIINIKSRTVKIFKKVNSVQYGHHKNVVK